MVLASGLTTSFVALVVGVVLIAPGSQDDEEPATTASRECLDRWNSDEGALSYARHNRTFHRYSEAQVGYLPDDGSSTTISDDPNHGSCVVVFARSTLDPEPGAAGQIDRGGRWTPLTQIVVGNKLAALQNAALRGANAQPTEEGELAPP